MSGLFSGVYRYANFKTREPHEVVLTAALSYCLERANGFRTRLLRAACTAAGVPLPRGAPPQNVILDHQRVYHRPTDDGHAGTDRPDIVIEYPQGQLVCAIECKLDAPITTEQASRYAAQLRQEYGGRPDAQRLVIGISAHRCVITVRERGVACGALTWTEVADIARSAQTGLDRRADRVVHFLLEEFRELLDSEGLVFAGFERRHLGDAAQVASEAFEGWYHLVRSARVELADVAPPAAGTRGRLARGFQGIGYDVHLPSWDGRNLRRTHLSAWVGVNPHPGGDDWTADWYPAANVWFRRHPQKADVLGDGRFRRGVERLGDSFRLDTDWFGICADQTPARVLLRGIQTPLAQQQAIMDYWRTSLRALNASVSVRRLLTFR
jgi:hypothetical protein